MGALKPPPTARTFFPGSSGPNAGLVPAKIPVVETSYIIIFHCKVSGFRVGYLDIQKYYSSQWDRCLFLLKVVSWCWGIWMECLLEAYKWRYFRYLAWEYLRNQRMDGMRIQADHSHSLLKQPRNYVHTDPVLWVGLGEPGPPIQEFGSSRRNQLQHCFNTQAYWGYPGLMTWKGPRGSGSKNKIKFTEREKKFLPHLYIFCLALEWSETSVSCV